MPHSGEDVSKPTESTLSQRLRAGLRQPMATAINLCRSRMTQVGASSSAMPHARRTGHDSEVSISKAFRRQYGTSPGAYRKASVAGL